MSEPRREGLADRLRRDPRYASLRRPSPEDAEQMQARSREALPVLRQLAGDMVEERGAPYDIGVSIWRTAMRSTSPSGTDGEHCTALWLLWGALTDRVELKPVERPAAEQAMLRAAREWLTVVDDEPAWRAYFDRWLYDELGYERPAASHD